MDKRLILLVAVIGTCLILSCSATDETPAKEESPCDAEIAGKLCAVIDADADEIAKLSEELKSNPGDPEVEEKIEEITGRATQLRELISKCDVCEKKE